MRTEERQRNATLCAQAWGLDIQLFLYFTYISIICVSLQISDASDTKEKQNVVLL